ncbi:MAG: hypothetical protein ABI624_25065, partial [Casimicrobiaceae bacterium]
MSSQLAIVHSHAPQLIDDRVILGVLGDGLDAHDVPDAVDRLRHRLVDRIAFHVLGIFVSGESTTSGFAAAQRSSEAASMCVR